MVGRGGRGAPPGTSPAGADFAEGYTAGGVLEGRVLTAVRCTLEGVRLDF